MTERNKIPRRPCCTECLTFGTTHFHWQRTQSHLETGNDFWKLSADVKSESLFADNKKPKHLTASSLYAVNACAVRMQISKILQLHTHFGITTYLACVAVNLGSSTMDIRQVHIYSDKSNKEVRPAQADAVTLTVTLTVVTLTQLAVASPSFPPQLWLVCLSSCCKLWQAPNMRSCWLVTPDQMKTKDVRAWLFHRKKAYRLINTTTYWLSLWDHGKRVLNV